MKAVDFNQPELLLEVFAKNGTKNTLPLLNTDSANPQRADLTNGFPLATQGSPEDGKLPPERADFNALGFLTTSYDYFYQAGGTFTFNSTISSAIGGYPLGARLWHTNSSGISMILRSTKDDNTDDFTQNESYIGTSWVVESMAGIDNSNVNILECKFSDKIINKMSWLLSDGNWKSGSTYLNAYDYLIDSIGYRAIAQSTAPSIYVSARNTIVSGYCVRRSSLDKTIGGIKYYAWNADASYSYDRTIYLTLNVDSMSLSEALNSMQGQRIYKTSDGTSMTLTVNKIAVETSDTYTLPDETTKTISYYLGSDGLKVVYVSNNGTEYEAVDELYNSLGVAWYYVIDTYNVRFKLPRTKYGFNGYRSNVGGYIEAGLPDLKGELSAISGVTSFVATGVFKEKSSFTTNPGGGTGNWRSVEFGASYGNDIYGNSDTVQPPATEMYLYFYVGAYNETAIQQTAGINASVINSKMDSDASNASSGAKNRMIGWIVPDYSAGVSVNFPFTAPATGYIIGNVDNSSSNIALYINDVEVCLTSPYDTFVNLMIDKDDVLTRERAFEGYNKLVFYPMKGAE